MRFTEEEKNSKTWIQENFGEEAVRHTIILFTHADHLRGKPLDVYIRDNPDLQTFTEEFGGRFHSFNNKNMENHSQVTELLEKIKRIREGQSSFLNSTVIFTCCLSQPANPCGAPMCCT